MPPIRFQRLEHRQADRITHCRSRDGRRPEMTEPNPNLADYFASHVVAIVYRHDEKDARGKSVKGSATIGSGSGFLLSYRGTWFLITAGHVIIELDELST